LTPPPARNADQGKRELDLAGEKLMATLRTFKVDGELVGRTTGPTVTQFEIEPAAGIKVRQIAALADDLALAMRAPSIRIVAPIPGRGAVGVEVPNPTPEMVVLRASRVVGAYEEAWDLLREERKDKQTGGFMPRNIMWVTGPSRSADIEQTLELGAHGPRALHIILVDDDPAAKA
jgi:DNA segregation ATPase FtsK/SpoIIIE-like protein